MAEEQEEGGCTQGSECGLEKTGPEEGRKLRSLQQMTEDAVLDNFEALMKTMIHNATAMKHMPSASMLTTMFNLAMKHGLWSEEVFESFAAELVRSFEELRMLEDVE